MALMLVVCGLAVALWMYHKGIARPSMYDLEAYRAGVRSWLIDGGSIYDRHLGTALNPLNFVYPPFAALVLAPFAGMSETWCFVGFTALSSAAYGLTVWWMVAPVIRKYGWSAWYSWSLMVILVFALVPVWFTFGLGQIGLVLLALVLLDFVLLSRGSKFAGVGIGLAAAIKLTPLLFIAYFAVTHRWRAMWTAIATTAAATAIGFVILPRDSWNYFFVHGALGARGVNNMERTDNQSLAGFVARIVGEPLVPTLPWLMLSIPVIAFALWRARRAYLRGSDLAGVALIGAATTLASPISWTHHLVWLLPALFVMLYYALEARGSVRLWWLSGVLAMSGLLAIRISAHFGPIVTQRQFHQPVIFMAVDAYIFLALLLVAFLPIPKETPLTPQLLPAPQGNRVSTAGTSLPPLASVADSR